MSRHTRNRGWAIGLALTTALAFVGPMQSAGAATPKLYAAPLGSGTICSAPAPCQLSQALINALPGTTIVLGGGIYNDQPTINKANLTIEGPKSAPFAVFRKNGAVVNAATPAAAPVTALMYIGPAGTGFTLTSVAITGSLANLPSASRFAGVYVRSSSVTLDHVTVTGIFPGTGFDGNQNGVSFYVRSDLASSSNVTMSNDTLNGYNKNGVACADTGTTCTISKSTATGVGPTTVTAQNGFQIGFGAGGSVSSSTATGHRYTPAPQASGILIYAAAAGVVVTKNTVSGNDNNIYAYASNNVSITKNTSGFSTFDGVTVDSLSGGTVAKNKLANNAEFGVGLYGATNATVSKNTIANSASDGIYVGGPGTDTPTSTSNQVNSNKVTASGGDGIHADTSAITNTFHANTTLNSVSGIDAHDQGSGNTWTATHCSTHASSTPLGIC